MSAPERIWLRWEPGAAVTNGPLTTHPDYSEYIRADLVEAAVKRALEWAAGLCADNTMDIPMDRSARVYAGMFCAGEHTGGIHQGMGYAEFIRAAPPDTIAKLARGE
jgi:hypothetical protein